MSFKYIEKIEVENEKTSIHWWKEIHNEMPEVLKDLKGTVLLAHNSIEFTDIINLLNKTRPHEFLNVLYISLMRSYQYMKETLDQKPLQEKKVSVIDCVSGYAFLPEDDIDNCFYHRPPGNLNEMKKIIETGMQKSNPDIVILDSLSHFINFSNHTNEELRDFYQFLDTIQKNMLNINQTTFILLYDSKMSSMKKLPKHGIDLVLRLEIEHSSPFRIL